MMIKGTDLELNKVYCSDCLDLMKKMPDNSVDLVVTDPLYGININKMNFVKSGAIKVGGAFRNDYTNHNTEWDNFKLTKEQFIEMQRISKNQIIFGANNFISILSDSRCWIIWDKRVEDKYTNDFADCELAWTSFDRPARLMRYLWSGMLQEKMNWKEKRYHPTQKPVALGRWILEKFAEKGDIIFDPFCGSGTFLVAGKQKGFNYLGRDKEQRYVTVSIEILRQDNIFNVIPQKTLSGVAD